jgi:hypothetical protein
MAALMALVLLAAPLGHLAKSHRIHVRLVRAFWPGPAIPLTRHEQKHATRPRSLQILADVSWLILVMLAVVIVLVTLR